jgi:hypothetical protein
MRPVFLLLVLLVTSAQAERIPLAVYGVEPQGVSLSTAAIITDIVRTKLRGCGQFDLVEKSKMEEILKLQGIQQTGCTEAECAANVGKILNVKKMVVGGLGKLGAAFRLSLRVVDVETAVIEAEDEEKQTVKEEDLDQLVPPLVMRLCPRIRMVGKAAPAGETGSLTITSTPSGAKLIIDGVLRGETPFGLSDVPVGGHQLTLIKDGYADYQEAMVIEPNQKKMVSAVLKIRTGSLRVFSKPSGASVEMDGENQGVTTKAGLLISGLKSGEHQLRFTHPYCDPFGAKAVVEPDTTKEVRGYLVVVEAKMRNRWAGEPASRLSALLPGLGQYYNKQPLKGAIIQAVFAGGVVMAVTGYKGQKKEYDPSLRDTVNRAKVTPWFGVGLITAFSTYLYSTIDAEFTGRKLRAKKLQEEGHLLLFRHDRYAWGLDFVPRGRRFEAKATLHF